MSVIMIISLEGSEWHLQSYRNLRSREGFFDLLIRVDLEDLYDLSRNVMIR